MTPPARHPLNVSVSAALVVPHLLEPLLQGDESIGLDPAWGAPLDFQGGLRYLWHPERKLAVEPVVGSRRVIGLPEAALIDWSLPVFWWAPRIALYVAQLLGEYDHYATIWTSDGEHVHIVGSSGILAGRGFTWRAADGACTQKMGRFTASRNTINVDMPTLPVRWLEADARTLKVEDQEAGEERDARAAIALLNAVQDATEAGRVI